MLRCTFNKPTLFQTGAEIVVIRRRIDAAKRKKTPILLWYQHDMLKTAQTLSMLPMSFGGKGHDGEWMIAGQQDGGRDRIMFLMSSGVFWLRRSGSVCNMLALRYSMPPFRYT